MLLKSKIAEGKTKIIYQDQENKDQILILSKDQITAGDGAKKNILKGKGKYSTLTASNCFNLLNLCGLKTHFIKQLEEQIFSSKKCQMIPLEVVIRRIAFGSYLKRNPHTPEGKKFFPPLIEFFLKDDRRHDPLINEEEIIKEKFSFGKRKIKISDLKKMKKISALVFEILEKAWQKEEVALVDLKIEFGIDASSDELLIADVIDNDSWRIWVKGDKSQMKDKQIYRNLTEITAKSLEDLMQNYKWAAQKTNNFFKKTNSRIIIFLGSKSDLKTGEEILKILNNFEINNKIRIFSAHKNTEDLLKILKKYENEDISTIYIAVAGRSNGLGPVIEGNTLNPVINCPPINAKFSGMDILSSLSLPRGIACGTIIEPENAALFALKILARDDLILWGKLKIYRYHFQEKISQDDEELNCGSPELSKN